MDWQAGLGLDPTENFLQICRIQARMCRLWKSENFSTKKKFRKLPIFPAISAVRRPPIRSAGLNAPRRKLCGATPMIATGQSSRKSGRTCCGAMTLSNAKTRIAGKGLKSPGSRWSLCEMNPIACHPERTAVVLRGVYPEQQQIPLPRSGIGMTPQGLSMTSRARNTLSISVA